MDVAHGGKVPSVRPKENRGRPGRRDQCLTLELRLLFPSSSLRLPVSDAAVWRKSRRLPCEMKRKGERCKGRVVVREKGYAQGEVG